MTQERAAPLMEDTDERKIQVEIVQGLLMAHARLDRMEDTLRCAVEAASLQHLKAFNTELKNVDNRFQQTADKFGKSIEELGEVRKNLVLSVEGASVQHLDAFTSQLMGVDEHFQVTASRIEETISSLRGIRDNLVASLEGLSLKHLEAFSKQVDGLQKTITDVHVEALVTLHKDHVQHQQDSVQHQLTGETRHEQIVTLTKTAWQTLESLKLDQRIRNLSETQAATKALADTEAKTQSGNWLNLNEYLKAWIRNLQKSQDDIYTRVTNTHTQLSHGIATLDSEQRNLFISLTEAIEQQVRKSARIIVVYLLAFGIATIFLLGGIVYKLFFR